MAKLPDTLRRRGEKDFEDPSEMSVMRRLQRSQTVDLILRSILMILLGGGAGLAVTEKKETDVTKASGDLAAMKTEYEQFRQRNRERNQERDATIQKLNDRIVALETKLEYLTQRDRRRATQ